MNARRKLRRAVLREQRAVPEYFRIGEFARFDFEAIVPVTAAKTFDQITRDGQMARARDCVETAARTLTQRRAGELVAEELRQGQQALEEITGIFTADDLLGRIFGSFCIGK